MNLVPDVFERGELFMPGEVGTRKGPWARDPVEAITYVILHEWAHFEAYVRKNATLVHFTPQGEGERVAHRFASSVLRCGQ